ncbi:hypothetical protein D9756_002604 [Leucocoprinus leucothites]|uniref:Phosphomannomutase n=1 Tax=Leucocoprinus leucothites TaxID=201217 RepID=A0A8H5LLB7_9AGAR|nr:hypothetical protein D9756_002604 [Leucoagaricus leucothites]
MSKTFKDRPRNAVCLFDVDDTLTPPRQPATPEMIKTLKELRKRVAVGFVSGSDFAKIRGQLDTTEYNVLQDMDYCFPENGLTAYKLGQPLPSESFITFIGEDRYKTLVNFILHYIADMDIPIKRGTFVEFRRGMINLTEDDSTEERLEFQRIDKQNGYRIKFVQTLREKFSDYGLTFSIGGQISFDVFPNGWDKTYALGRIEDENFEEIHFFGDRCSIGGNDYEIYADPRTIGHSVSNPEETIRLIKELFLS